MPSSSFGHPPQGTLPPDVNGDLASAEREPVESQRSQCPPSRQNGEVLSSGQLIKQIGAAHRDPDSRMPGDAESLPVGESETEADAPKRYSPPSPTSPGLPEIPGYQAIRNLGSGGMG